MSLSMQRRSRNAASTALLPARLIAGHHGQLRSYNAVWRARLCLTAQPIRREESAPAAAWKGTVRAILWRRLNGAARQTFGPDCKGCH